MRRLSLTAALQLSACIALGSSLYVLASCSSTTEEAAADGGSDAGVAEQPEPVFRALQADLVRTCGGVQGACHVNGTHRSAQGEPASTWLGAPDPYVSAKTYPGIIPVTGEVNDSKLLTQVEHDGPALVSTPALFERVKTWVAAELRSQGTRLPVTDAFLVKEGANTVDLGRLAENAAGAKLTFEARESSGTLFLSKMEITAPEGRGLQMDSPFFVVLPATGPTRSDPLSGFPGLLTVPAAETKSFYTGATVLQEWNPLNRLKLVFQRFETTAPVVAGDAGGGCKALGVFESSALPALQADLGDGKSCQTCHGETADGGGIEVATAAMDLRMLGVDNAAACAQALFHVNLRDREKSNILLTPTGGPGGSPSHPVKTRCADNPAPPCVSNEVVDGLLGWVRAE